MLKVYWWKEDNNFGDVMNPYLLHYLSGQQVTWSESSEESVLLAAGSVLHVGKPGWQVWGTGCISTASPISDGLHVLAVRGPRTLERLRQKGYAAHVPMGDPGLLLPLVYPGGRQTKYEWGIIPHYVDYPSFWRKFLRDKMRNWAQFRPGKNVLLINPSWPLERYLEAMHSCKRIASTSLHGLIVADAYGIPNLRFTMSNKIVGGDFKFQDYQESVGRTGVQPVVLSQLIPWDEFDGSIRSWKPACWNPEPLLEVFPAKSPAWETKVRRARDHFKALAELGVAG